MKHLKKHKTKGFSFIEILVVVTIIGILFGVTAITYTNVTKGSRDAKRKTDLENVRVALEQYRSNNSSYPVDINTLTANPKYLETIPTDPQTNNQYTYTPTCNGSSCYSYSLQATLEYPANTQYTVTPYGSSSTTPTNTPPVGGGGSCSSTGATCTVGTSCCSGVCDTGVCK